MPPAINGSAAISRHDMVAYYEQCEWDYRWAWDLDASMAMHIGYWNDSMRSLRHALARQNHVLAEAARVGPGDLVLDAGCGVGGSSIYLAKRYGCRVVGISLSRRQIESAKRNARRCGVSARTEFLVGDFTAPAFRSATFDVVWALESVCYARDKSDFVRASRRVLRPGGRLAVGPRAVRQVLGSARVTATGGVPGCPRSR